MNKLKLRVWLIVLALLSLFTGLPINGNWFMAYGNTFGGINRYIINPYGVFEWTSFLQWLLTFLTGCAILLFPVVFQRIKHFRIVLIIIPLPFLVNQTHLFLPIVVVFVPFMIVWIITIFLAKPKQS